MTLQLTGKQVSKRLGKVQDLMKARNLDCLYITHLGSEANLVYLSGYRTELFISRFVPLSLVFPREGDPVLVIRALETEVAKNVSWVQDVRTYGEVLGAVEKDPMILARRVLSELGLSEARIGVEKTSLPVTYLEKLKEQLPKADFVDCTSLLWEARAVKSTEEIELIRKSCVIADKAMEAGINLIAEGVTEKDVAAEIGSSMMKNGAYRVGFICVHAGPKKYRRINQTPSDYRLQKGDMIGLDIGCTYEGYWSDFTRVAIVGKPSDQQKKMYGVALRSLMKGVEAARSGATCSDIDVVTARVIIEAGYRDHMLHRAGHSLGLEVHELPSLSEGNLTPIVPGMVLSVEPGFYVPEVGPFRLEDTVLVTKDGNEVLSHFPLELQIR